MNRHLSPMITLLLVAATAGIANAGPGRAPKSPRTVVVGTDPSGDWGGNGALGPAADALSSDLVEAQIALVDPKTLNFVLGLNSLSEEAAVTTVYVWRFGVDDNLYNIVNGCDADPASECATPAPGEFNFLIQKCSEEMVGVLTQTTCEPVSAATATADTANGTLTIPVSMSDLGATPGSSIVGDDSFGAAVLAYANNAYVNVNDAGTPYDALSVTKTFTVPGRLR